MSFVICSFLTGKFLNSFRISESLCLAPTRIKTEQSLASVQRIACRRTIPLSEQMMANLTKYVYITYPNTAKAVYTLYTILLHTYLHMWSIHIYTYAFIIYIYTYIGSDTCIRIMNFEIWNLNCGAPSISCSLSCLQYVLPTIKLTLMVQQK